MSYSALFTLFPLCAVLLCYNAVLGLHIISRSEWGARAPTSRSNLSNNLDYAVIHHTALNYCSNQTACSQELRSIQDLHMDTNGWADIGYNFLIGGDGQVYEGRGWNILGAHTFNWNSRSIGISLLGNYNNVVPTAGQICATRDLLAAAVSRCQIKSNYTLYGHRQLNLTECPGNNLYAEIQTWANWREA